MDANIYQKMAIRTNIYTDDRDLALGFFSEVGEFVGVVSKIGRDKGGKADDEDKEKLTLEGGDVLWGIATLMRRHGKSLSTIWPIDDAPNAWLMQQYNIYEAAGALCECAGKAAIAVIEKNKDDFFFFIDSAILMLFVLFWKYRILVDVVMDRNIAKLSDRAARGVIGGSGDNR